MTDNQMTIAFNYEHDEDGSWAFSKAYDDATPWDTVLVDFLRFLSSIYGYDIRDKVSFETLEEKTERLSSMFEGD